MAHAEVLEAFNALFEALTQERDAARGSALFAADEDVVMWGSGADEHAVGPAAVAELHRAIAARPDTLVFHWRERHVRVEGDVGWVNAAGEVVAPGGDGEQRVPYRLTAVLVRRQGSWRWHTFSGSVPD